MSRSGYFFLCLFFYFSMLAKGQTISTIAGGMLVGYSGDGGPATDAALNAPGGMCVDGAGNVYFADVSNNCVRKINTAGIITTVAGNNTAGLSGDGGPATSAQLNEPMAVAVDTSGNLYIVDNSNHCIRKVNATGIITRFAGTGVMGFSGDGGLAISAQLHYPEGVAVDGSGNVFVCDAGNERVRKVDASGIITTVAGSGSVGSYGDRGPATAAAFVIMYGIAVDDTGNIYIADAGNECVRKVNTAGIITNFAGNHYSTGMYAGGYKGDGGPATAAELNYAEYIAVDKNGNVYIADINNNRVRMVNAAGIITTIAGDGIPGYNGDGDNPVSRELYYPRGVATDAHGNVYIAEESNNRIRLVTHPDVVVKQVNAANGKTSNYPNPFTSQTTITYSLADASGNTMLVVTNVLGQHVFTRSLGAQNAGIHELIFKEELSPGVYYYTIANETFRSTMKMIVTN
jgi:sugar lactone lactonase YvrE